MEAEMREGHPVVEDWHGDLKAAEGPRSGGERSEPERRGPSETATGLVRLKEAERPDPEVPAKARRRRFSARYKKKILEEADACKGNPGAGGALLRREGLYSSHLTTWRKQWEKGPGGRP